MGKDSNGFEKTEIIHRGKVAYTVEKHEKRPFKVPARPTAFFDVDDTLVMWDIPEGIEINDDRLVSINCKGIEDRLFPNKHNIELLKKFSARGHSVVVWSGGGADWAEAVVDALGLNQYVDVVVNKPQYYMDDIANPKEWIGKHGYFKLDGTRVNGDNLSKGDY
jgi:hypothetical protein